MTRTPPTGRERDALAVELGGRALGELDRENRPGRHADVPRLDEHGDCTRCGEHASLHIRRGHVLPPAEYHAEEATP